MISRGDLDYIKSEMYSRGQNQDFSTDNMGFGLFHYAFICNLRPERVLAIGSQRGFVPAMCGLACRDNKKGVVDFVDAGYGLSDKNSWGGIGLWKTVGREYWKPLGLESIVNLHLGTTEDYFNTRPNKKYDYVYVDGDHSYEGVRADYELSWGSLNLDGYMVFHDVLVDCVNQYGKCGVKKFWTELGGEKLTIPLAKGLGILRKTDEN